MNVLLAHNSYQRPGGEDRVFEAEADLLERYGHKVVRHRVFNEQIERLSTLQVGVETIWNRSEYGKIRQIIQSEDIDVLHVHNTLPRLSPAVLRAGKKEGIPVVQTLHNYRLICPNALLFRDGHVCEECIEAKIPLPGVIHGCYRDSSATSAVVATTIVAHRWIGTWRNSVDLYLALTEFARRKFILGGLPADRIQVRPNFVDPDPGPGTHTGGYALFVGRLVPEKGIASLLESVRGTSYRLKVVGDGPLAEQVVTAGEPVEWLGHLPKAEVFALMKEASVLIFPSEWYEGFGLSMIEAFATATPVIASRMGAMEELVDPGRTGLLFEPGDVVALRERIQWAFENPSALAEMGLAARREYLHRYTAAAAYDSLIGAYRGLTN